MKLERRKKIKTRESLRKARKHRTIGAYVSFGVSGIGTWLLGKTSNAWARLIAAFMSIGGIASGWYCIGTLDGLDMVEVPDDMPEFDFDNTETEDEDIVI